LSTTVVGTGTRFEVTRTTSSVSFAVDSLVFVAEEVEAFAGFEVDFEVCRGPVLLFAFVEGGFWRPDCESDVVVLQRQIPSTINTTENPRNNTKTFEARRVNFASISCGFVDRASEFILGRFFD